MLSKRMTAFRVLIVTYFDAIEEFMQPGNCYKCPHYGGQLYVTQRRVNCNNARLCLVGYNDVQQMF